MTPDIDRLRALMEKATPGPWTGYRTGILHNMDWVVHNAPKEDGIIMSDEDAYLIGQMRNALPALLSSLTRLRAIEAAARTYIYPDDKGSFGTLLALKAALDAPA